jgi:LmbE family N-acetylglucosaminyl deacetylase
MKVLFLGAHPDDVELGAAGLLAKLQPENEVKVIVFSDCEEQPGNQGITKELEKSMEAMEVRSYTLLDMANTRFPENAEKVRKILEKERDSWKPDAVVVHSINSIHQDHRTLAEECVRVFRNQSILMYEDIKSTPKFQPNLVVSLTKEQMEKKIRALNCYKTQLRHYYFDIDFIRSLAKVRGKLMNLEYGEAFEVWMAKY